jgi:hypothetical protein
MMHAGRYYVPAITSVSSSYKSQRKEQTGRRRELKKKENTAWERKKQRGNRKGKHREHEREKKREKKRQGGRA